MITSPTQQPPMDLMGGCIHYWERAPDPWHRDAFPDQFKPFAPNTRSRRWGWLAIDGVENPIGWIPDGTEFKDAQVSGREDSQPLQKETE